MRSRRTPGTLRSRKENYKAFHLPMWTHVLVSLHSNPHGSMRSSFSGPPRSSILSPAISRCACPHRSECATCVSAIKAALRAIADGEACIAGFAQRPSTAMLRISKSALD